MPTWSFPGRGRVQSQLQRARTVLTRAEGALATLPLRGRQAEWSANIEERREEVERALGYVELYGAYAECEALYGVDHLLGIVDRQSEADRQRFCCDPRVVDWDDYVTGIHLPSIVTHARVRTTPGPDRTPDRAERLRRAVLSPERQLAAFDLENTLIASNVVSSYLWLASRHLTGPDRLRLVANALRSAPGWLSMDRRDRSDFLRLFYRRYDRAPADQLRLDSEELFSDLLALRAFPGAIRRVREHRRLGHRTVLITGALDLVVDPLRPLFDDVIATELETRNGELTGELRSAPPTGETRAQLLIDYAAAHGCDLAESVAYADSTSDLPMLEVVGFPVAVNPETRLSALARKRGWLVEQWDRASGAPGGLLPLGGHWSGDHTRTPLLERLVNAGSGSSIPDHSTSRGGRRGSRR